MPALRPDVDPDGLLEYSVVYTDRALNHMSARFQGVMRDLSDLLCRVYQADQAVVVPGSGTFGMEAVARQFASGRPALVVRNGWFSYRWSQIFDMGSIPSVHEVCKARRTGAGPQAPFEPAPLDEVIAAIERLRPAVVCAPHVETASGLLLGDDYLRRLAEATHAVGGLLVLDCIASGCLWVDMRALGVDVLVTAPQKGWSGSPGCAFVMLSARAIEAMAGTTSSSFACDLKKWSQIMEAYRAGGHAYHATMPTDSLAHNRDVMRECEVIGFERLQDAQRTLGRAVRTLLVERGFPSVAAAGWQAPGVVVSYTQDPEIQSARAFAPLGLQTAAGVPLQCDEGPDFRTFRLGLFGLDKLRDVDGTVGRLRAALDRL
ncbi:MAG: hypothetical protein RLY78_2919 [Pseudomonadota bacterium]|jgi:aspartate aminotransferase-like enzyme